MLQRVVLRKKVALNSYDGHIAKRKIPLTLKDPKLRPDVNVELCCKVKDPRFEICHCLHISPFRRLLRLI